MSKNTSKTTNTVEASVSGKKPVYSERGSRVRVSGRSIISLVFILILFISAIRVVSGYSPISLSSFLSQVAGAPSISTGWIGNIDTNLGNIFPTGLKWLGKFFDFFVDGVSFALYFSVMVVNIIPYLFYFLKWLLL